MKKKKREQHKQMNLFETEDRMASGGWTIVHYGKMWRLAHGRGNQQGGFPSGGMAHAFPSSQRWQAQSPFPNQQVETSPHGHTN